MREFYGAVAARQLRPKVLVDYFREAYTYPAGNVRVTFDLDIRSGQYASMTCFRERLHPSPYFPAGSM